MSEPRVKWGDLVKFCDAHQDYEIRPKHANGEKLFIGPVVAGGRRHALAIGHTSCGSKRAEVKKGYISQIKTVYGLTVSDLLMKKKKKEKE